MACPNCNSLKNDVVKHQIFRCRKCGALHGTCYLGDSYDYVLPYMTDADPQMERSVYFDFICLGSTITRRHGWFDPETKRITQVG